MVVKTIILIGVVFDIPVMAALSQAKKFTAIIIATVAEWLCTGFVNQPMWVRFPLVALTKLNKAKDEFNLRYPSW